MTLQDQAFKDANPEKKERFKAACHLWHTAAENPNRGKLRRSNVTIDLEPTAKKAKVAKLVKDDNLKADAKNLEPKAKKAKIAKPVKDDNLKAEAKKAKTKADAEERSDKNANTSKVENDKPNKTKKGDNQKDNAMKGLGGVSVSAHGCSKCRWALRGCSRCVPNFNKLERK